MCGGGVIGGMVEEEEEEDGVDDNGEEEEVLMSDEMFSFSLERISCTSETESGSGSARKDEGFVDD